MIFVIFAVLLTDSENDTMKKQFFLFFFLGLILLTSCASSNRKKLIQLIPRSVNTAVLQAYAMSETLSRDTTQLPRTINDKGKLLTSDSRWWGSGFYPGSL